MVKKKTKRASRKPKVNQDLVKALALALAPPPELTAAVKTATQSIEQMTKQVAAMDAQLRDLVLRVAGPQAASVLVEPAPMPSDKPLNG